MLFTLNQMLKQEIPSEAWYYDLDTIAINTDYIIRAKLIEKSPIKIYALFMADGNSVCVDEDAFKDICFKSK